MRGPIKVSNGPMKGLEGIIESYDHRKKRLKIRLELLGQIKKVDLGAELVVKEQTQGQTDMQNKTI